MEYRASGLVKHASALISLSKLSGNEAKLSQADGVLDRGHSDREPPMAPNAFAEMLENGVQSGNIKFTNKGDVSLVSRIYGDAFNSAMEDVIELHYEGLEWADDAGVALIEALRYAHTHGGLKKLKLLNLYKNQLGDKTMTALAALLDEGGLSGLEYLGLDDNAISNWGMQELASAIARGGLPLCTGIYGGDNEIRVHINPGNGAPVQNAFVQRQKQGGKLVAAERAKRSGV